MEQPKIERMLHFITLLADKRGYTIDEIAQKLELSRRSAFRYIETFKDARFVIDKEKGRYRLATNKGCMKELADTIWFTEEEAYLIKRLIDELDNTNSLKAGLMKKTCSHFKHDQSGGNYAQQGNFRKYQQSCIGHKRKQAGCT